MREKNTDRILDAFFLTIYPKINKAVKHAKMCVQREERRKKNNNNNAILYTKYTYNKNHTYVYNTHVLASVYVCVKC